ncbi:unnamed protein product [Allacma fusca]|uniref:Uncharacterized protein n=1 Tax=Allacma fusca TaxID=39272 RepID=A0A8J2NL87_9HEXA|nr:unnamed protein product [Allacma fusca]
MSGSLRHLLPTSPGNMTKWQNIQKMFVLLLMMMMMTRTMKTFKKLIMASNQKEMLVLESLLLMILLLLLPMNGKTVNLNVSRIPWLVQRLTYYYSIKGSNLTQMISSIQKCSEIL